MQVPPKFRGPPEKYSHRRPRILEKSQDRGPVAGGDNFEKRGTWHSQSSQTGRMWQRPLKRKIPISLPVASQRLEWKPAFRRITGGLGREEEREESGPSY